MGFAAQWAAMMGESQPPTPKDKLDRMDTIQPEGNSVHCVHIVHRGSTSEKPPKVSTPEPKGTGLEWLPGPPDSEGPAFDTWWLAFDLADLAKLYGVRIVHAGERILAVYPPTLEPELVAYASELLAEARPYLAAYLEKLPTLTPADAVKIILEIMQAHKGLRFCRGDDGSRWPIYPRQWTAGQRVTVQALWFVAGDGLDRDDFREVAHDSPPRSTLPRREVG